MFDFKWYLLWINDTHYKIWYTLLNAMLKWICKRSKTMKYSEWTTQFRKEIKDMTIEPTISRIGQTTLNLNLESTSNKENKLHLLLYFLL